MQIANADQDGWIDKKQKKKQQNVVWCKFV